jgi:hypothetical protein
MRITADRRIEVNKGVEVTEAARLVLDAMQGMLDVGLDKAVLADPVREVQRLGQEIEQEPPQRTEPLIGCVNHDCAKCKERNT